MLNAFASLKCLKKCQHNVRKPTRKRLADACLNTELFLEEKIAKREQRAIETLINNPLVDERAFYRLNERFCVK